MTSGASNPWILQAPRMAAQRRPSQAAPPTADDAAADLAAVNSMRVGRRRSSCSGGASPAPLSLFCFPPAGTGACVYHGWEASLPAEVEVLPVELPGRNSRVREPAIYDMRQLVGAMLPGLMPLLEKRPFAFFGHSMGAWVAFAVTQELAAQGGPLPLKLYASANRSPLLAGPQHDVHAVVMHRLPPAKFWGAMEQRYGPNPNLEHPGVRKLLLPMMLADFRLIETWRPGGPSRALEGQDDRQQRCAEPEAAGRGEASGMGSTAAQEEEGGVDGATTQRPLVLPCPVAAIGATQDVRYTRRQLAAWRLCTQPGFYEERWFEGWHTYITADCPGRQQLLQWLAADLPRLASVAAGPRESSGQRVADLRRQLSLPGIQVASESGAAELKAEGKAAEGEEEGDWQAEQWQDCDWQLQDARPSQHPRQAVPPRRTAPGQSQAEQAEQGRQQQEQQQAAPPVASRSCCWSCWV